MAARRKPLTDTDRGWKAMKKRLGVSGTGILGRRKIVKVGIQGADASEPADENGVITTVVLAAVHEFGRLDGSIPERSFIRATVEKNRAEYIKLVRRLSRLVLLGKLTEKKALAIIGQQVMSDIQAAMEEGLEPGLAASTIRQKKRQGKKPPYKPLIDTGHLKNSVTYDVVA